MLFVTFDIYCAERAHRAEVFAGSAAYAALGVNHRDARRSIVARLRWHHLYCAYRAVAGTVATLHAIGERHAILFHPHRMTYVNSRFFGRGYLDNRPGGTHLGAAGALGAAVAALIGHFGLH